MAQWMKFAVLGVLCLFIILSLISYDYKDIGLLVSPPNSAASNFMGPAGAWLAFVLFMAFGLAGYIVPFMILGCGIKAILYSERKIWHTIVACIVLLLSLSAITELQSDICKWICYRLNITETGGMIGYLLMRGWLLRWFGTGAMVIAWFAFIFSFISLVGLANMWKSIRWLGSISVLLFKKIKALRMRLMTDYQRIEFERRLLERQKRRLERAIERERSVASSTVATPAKDLSKDEQEKIDRRTATEKQQESATATIEQKETSEPDEHVKSVTEQKHTVTGKRSYVLPPLQILSPLPDDKTRDIETDTDTTSRVLVETLEDFGIECKVVNAEQGPVVTRYEILPAPGVRIERIASLSNNIALSLKASSVRIQTPIPGKGVVGVEVPNSSARIVYLRDVLESEEWQNSDEKLPLLLGKDVAGADVVVDLTEMPHLLIAGATGSGKTVCLNTILTGLLMSRTPEQMRLLLVDPKLVEFSAYSGIPHLIAPVIIEPKKVVYGLRWAINEMEARYKLFARVGVRNIEIYNSRNNKNAESSYISAVNADEKYGIPPPSIPYIVIVVDELADLMLTNQADIENCIARLAQLSRAVGIHMILSTQRPSVNVITGTIKANFPSRIAFQVAQRVDSRTIIDTIGAEKLLGRGDMLFMPPGSNKLIRAQAAYTTDADIQAVTNFWKNQGEPEYELQLKQQTSKGDSSLPEELEEDEELINQAIEIIRETKRASTSSLQRRLRIGYTRAARIMDILEERGIVGPPRGADPREILVDLDIDDNVTPPHTPEVIADIDTTENEN